MRKDIITVAVLLALIVVCFWPCLKASFLFWDDPIYLTDNLSVRSLTPGDIMRIFRSHVSGTYIPLSVLTYAVEFHFFGLKPFVYHLDNLLLHLVNISLILFLGRRLGLGSRAAFFAALLFGIHPMHVEAVAWITSRKDLLYTFFFLSAMMGYWGWLDGRGRRYYFLSLAAALLSMLAKPMALSLPLVLIWLDWFRSRRWDKAAWLDKLPFFLIAIPIGWLTYRFHVRIPGTDLGSSMLTWIWCLAFYLKKFIWPYPCLAIYAIPENFSDPSFDLAVAIFILFVGLLIVFRRQRLWIFAAGFFLLNIFYLLRFDTRQDLQIVSDRYMYLASLGFCLLAGRFLGQGGHYFQKINRWPRRMSALAGAFVLLALGILSFRQCGLWADEPALWRHTIRFNPESVTYQKLGDSFFMKDQDEQARPYYEEALRLDPENYEVMTNLAIIHAARWQLPKSLHYSNRAIAIAPDYSGAYINRAVVFGKLGQMDKALGDLSKAIELDPGRVMAYINRGNVYMQLKWTQMALQDYNQAIRLNPFATQAYFNRGLVHLRMGDLPGAEWDFRQALRLDPGHDRARNYLKNIRVHKKRFPLSPETSKK